MHTQKAEYIRSFETGIKILCIELDTRQPIYIDPDSIYASIDLIEFMERYSTAVVPEATRQQYTLPLRIAYHGQQVTDIESMILRPPYLYDSTDVSACYRRIVTPVDSYRRRSSRGTLVLVAPAISQWKLALNRAMVNRTSRCFPLPCWSRLNRKIKQHREVAAIRGPHADKWNMALLGQTYFGDRRIWKPPYFDDSYYGIYLSVDSFQGCIWIAIIFRFR